MLAPCSRACWATSARPSPEPGRSAAASRRANGSKIRSRSASGMPGAVVVDGQHGRRAGGRARPGPSRRSRPWRAAFSTRLSTSSRRPGLPAADARPARRAGRASNVAAGWRGARVGDGARDDLGEVDVARARRPVASPRASACRPSSRSTSRRCSDSASLEHRRALLGRRCRGGGAAPTASPGRSSAACAARGRRRRRSAASRPARARGRPPSAPSRASIALKRRGQRAQLGRPVGPGHAPVEVLLGRRSAGARRRSRRSGRSTQRRRRARCPAPRDEQREQPEPQQPRSSSAWRALERGQRRTSTSSRARPPRPALAQRRRRSTR